MSRPPELPAAHRYELGKLASWRPNGRCVRPDARRIRTGMRSLGVMCARELCVCHVRCR